MWIHFKVLKNQMQLVASYIGIYHHQSFLWTVRSALLNLALWSSEIAGTIMVTGHNLMRTYSQPSVIVSP